MRPQKPAQVQVEVLPDGRMDSVNAARYIGCSPKTLAHMRCSGKGPLFVKPGRIFYYQGDLDEWLSGHGRSAQYGTARRCGTGKATGRTSMTWGVDHAR